MNIRAELKPRLVPIIGVFIWLSGFLLIARTQESSGSLAKGEVINRVVCRNNSEHSYALYLPSYYSDEKKWPIIFGFDSGGRGSFPVNRFREAAETYGYIVVGSHNSRNGPSEPISRAIRVLWSETRNRFPLDFKRIYSTGFSGGARVASRFHLMTEKSCAGIIACGAGLSRALTDLNQVKPAAWYGIIGLSDFNYLEMKRLDTDFDGRGIIHHLDVFDGDHSWPPAEVCSRAVEWMEILAVAADDNRLEDSVLQSICGRFMQRGQDLEDSGLINYAFARYTDLENRFNGLLDTGLAGRKKAGLLASGKISDFQKEERGREKEEKDYHSRFSQVLRRIEISAGRLASDSNVFSDLSIKVLLKKTKSESLMVRSTAWRVLFDLYIRCRNGALAGKSSGSYDRSALYWRIAVATTVRQAVAHFSLARVYSLNRQKKKALKQLRLAVEAGFSDRAFIEGDEELAFIRSSKAFREILELIR